MPQSGNSEVNSCPVQLSKQTEQQEVVQEIYFGIFFDGTNNNKLQVMLGKRYRRDKCLREVIAKANKCEYSWNQIKFLIDKGIIEGKVFLVEKRMDPDSRFPVPSKSMPLNKETYEQLKKEHKLNNIIFNPKVNGNGLINIDRELWETPKKDKYTDSDDIIDAVADKRGRGILSQSQIDELYFGYDSKDPDLYFIEDRISRQLDDRDYSPENEINGSSAIGWDKSEKTDHFSFASYKAGDNERIKRDADSFTNQNSRKHEVPQTNFKSPSHMGFQKYALQDWGLHAQGDVIPIIGQTESAPVLFDPGQFLEETFGIQRFCRIKKNYGICYGVVLEKLNSTEFKMLKIFIISGDLVFKDSSSDKAAYLGRLNPELLDNFMKMKFGGKNIKQVNEELSRKYTTPNGTQHYCYSYGARSYVFSACAIEAIVDIYSTLVNLKKDVTTYDKYKNFVTEEQMDQIVQIWVDYYNGKKRPTLGIWKGWLNHEGFKEDSFFNTEDMNISEIRKHHLSLHLYD